jgi:hypothetical protein
MIKIKLYIQFDSSGNTIDHPMMFDSAQIVVGLKLNQLPSNITEQDILNNNFAILEDNQIHISEHIIGEDGYKRLPNGNFTRNFIIKTLTQEEKLDKWVRGRRDNELYNCDWTQLPDNDLTDEERVKWLEYRSYLRKMTEIYANIQHPGEAVWLQPPLRKPRPAL